MENKNHGWKHFQENHLRQVHDEQQPSHVLTRKSVISATKTKTLVPEISEAYLS